MGVGAKGGGRGTQGVIGTGVRMGLREREKERKVAREEEVLGGWGEHMLQFSCCTYQVLLYPTHSGATHTHTLQYFKQSSYSTYEA